MEGGLPPCVTCDDSPRCLVAHDTLSAGLGATDPFDVVFCLNVLDRCKDPFVLIDQVSLLSLW